MNPAPRNPLQEKPWVVASAREEGRASANHEKGPLGEGTGAAEELYLDLLKKCLTRYVFPEKWRPIRPTRPLRRVAYGLARAIFKPMSLELVRAVRFDPAQREQGEDWPPPEAETMIGLRRLDNLQFCITGDTQRMVWAADSFQGLPAPDPRRLPASRRDPSYGEFWDQVRATTP
jgi:hypothetical protein